MRFEALEQPIEALASALIDLSIAVPEISETPEYDKLMRLVRDARVLAAGLVRELYAHTHRDELFDVLHRIMRANRLSRPCGGESGSKQRLL